MQLNPFAPYPKHISGLAQSNRPTDEARQGCETYERAGVRTHEGRKRGRAPVASRNDFVGMRNRFVDIRAQMGQIRSHSFTRAGKGWITNDWENLSWMWPMRC